MNALKLNALTYEFKYSKNEDIKIMLMSDIHFDNPKCNRELFFEHLKKARKEGAKVFINGDLFCIMQGKYDPRRSKKDVRPEHNKADYIDAVIDDTVDILSPYADVIAFIGEGNHETAILKNLETDVLARFVDKFNERNKTKVIKGGYRGWLIIRKEYSPGKFISYKIYYNHGFGGGGEMSKGILQHSRSNMYIESADAIWMGHVHELYALLTMTEYFDNSPAAFCAKVRTVYQLRTSAYKEEFADCTGGYHIEKGRQPKPLGGIYLDLSHERGDNNSHILHPNYTIWAA
jgi:hypothetical protein